MICLSGNDGYALGYKIFVISYAGFEILNVLGYACYTRELVVHSLRSLYGGRLDPNGGRYLYHGVPHKYGVDYVLAY